MLFVLLLFAFCSLVASQSNIASGFSNFALDFYKECAQTPGDIVISPLSVATVFTLLSQAANGTTLDQLQKRLFPAISKELAANQYHELVSQLQRSSNDATVSMVNRIYVNKAHEINPYFAQVAKEKFLSGIESMDFTKSDDSAKTINDLVKNQTHGKINDIVKSSDFDDRTEMYLINAIYFKANWEYKFNKSLTTKQGDFHANGNQVVPVDYMHMKAKLPYGDWDSKQAQILELRYSNSPYSFVILLPDQGMDLPTLQSRFSADEFDNFLRTDVDEAEVEVQMPKFAIEYEVDLKNVLEKLNMGEMFKFKRDLSGLLKDGKDLRVSKATHKAVIEVNEDGSEAAGATSVGIENRSLMPTRQVKFVVDRPFMYFIRNFEKNIVLFSGRVENFKAQPAYLKGASSPLIASYILFMPVLLVLAIQSKIGSLMTRF